MTKTGTATPATPSHISHRIDAIIDNLNNVYDLRLPRLTGAAATKAEEEKLILELEISSKIRFLCFRTSNLQAVLDDFDHQAKRIFSEWVSKPLQEEGTLLQTSRPLPQNYLKRDVISTAGSAYTDKHRERLLSLLSEIIGEEYKLAKESSDYERVSPDTTRSRATSRASSQTQSFVSARSGHTRTRSNVKSIDRGRTPTSSARSPSPKKRESSRNMEESPKKQKKTTDFFHQTKSTAKSNHSFAPNKSMPPPSGFISSTPPGIKSSFETISTQQSEKIFSDIDENEDAGIVSVESSMVASFEDESQDYFPTQDVREYLNDASFTSDLDVADNAKSMQDEFLQELKGTGPFRRQNESLPVRMPYWQKFEMYRFASITGDSPIAFYDKIANTLRDASYDITKFRQLINSTVRDIDIDASIQHSDIRDWTLTENIYEDSKDWKSTNFTGKLEFSLDKPAELFQFSLDPIKIDRSCRFHRQFGADRFMIIYLPYMTTDRVPKKIKEWYKDKDDTLNKAVFKWLATEVHHIAGRQWRAFFLEPDKSQSKKKRDEQGQRQKLHLFAIDTNDLSSQRYTPLSEFMNWHIPLDANMDTTDLKLFSRFSLGLSKTIPTVQLRPSEFYKVPAPEKEKADMSDGCAKMSIELARAVWSECGDGTNDLPSAFQARVAGAKGLWIVDYERTRDPVSERGYWIEIADSQLKIKPHPRDRLDADPNHLVFEVLKYSKPCTSGGLNTQLITILEDRKVPRSVLKDAMLSNISKYILEANDAMTDPIKLRAWVQQYHASFLGGDASEAQGGLPGSLEAEICLLVESGFDAQSCSRLRKSLKVLMTQELNNYVDKMRIGLTHSTNVFCAPDLYGVLAPGEVHLGFSAEWENPRTGLKEIVLDQMNVLVARNPAHLASDIQKVTAVYKHQLRHFKNVILFPTTGDVPLASLLSGGDYDGDTVAVIWDPNIVDAFRAARKPQLPSEEECGMQNWSRKVASYFQGTSRKEGLDLFLEACLSFNAHGNLLGICTSEFEKIVYNQVPLKDPRAIKLAALASYLVDSNKQGSWLSPLAWKAIRTEITSKMQLRSPQYKSDNPRPRRMERHHECVNVIDFLKFDVAQKEKDDMLKNFERSFASHATYDIGLSDLFKAEEQRSKSKSDPQSSAVHKVIIDLRKRLQDVVDKWDKDMGKANDDSRDKNFERAKQCAFRRVQAIQPSDVKCDIVRDFHREGGIGQPKASRWSLLRASTMYRFHHQKSVVWHTVGWELCRIKARIQSSGDTRELVPSMHGILKADLSKIARLYQNAHAGIIDLRGDASDSDDDDEDSDEFFDADG